MNFIGQLPMLQLLNSIEVKGLMLKKDGSSFYTDVSGSIVTFNGKSHILSAVRDISEMKASEHELKNAYANLELTNRELEQFTYVSSHDLQEPLRKIKNYSELLVIRNREQLDEDGRKYLDIISRGTKRMQNLIDDLLGISRVSSRGVEFTTVNTARILRGYRKTT